MQINGITICAEDNSLLLINPYETHYGDILSEEFIYYCLDFDMKMLGLDNEKNILSEHVKYKNYIPDAHMYKELIDNICICYEKEPDGWKLAAKGYFLLLFSKHENMLYSALPSKENDFTKNIIDYLENNYAKEISSSSISQALNYNQSYFCRMFKKIFSCRFCDYLNIYRVKKAKEFLKIEKVSDTAFLTGFSNMSYFSVIFKQYTGMTPIEYKKSQKNNK